MRTRMQGSEFNYPDMENKSYAIYKEINTLNRTSWKIHVKAVIPHPAIRSLFVKNNN